MVLLALELDLARPHLHRESTRDPCQQAKGGFRMRMNQVHLHRLGRSKKLSNCDKLDPINHYLESNAIAVA